MTKDDYLELIKNHRKKLNCIDKLLLETEVMIQNGYPVNEIYGKFLSVVEQTEKFNLLMRELPVYTGEPRVLSDVYEIVEKTVNIEIGYTEQGWFCVKMPWLLQKKEHGNNSYIRSILYPAMEKFFKNKVRYKPKDAVLVYRHVYEEESPEKKMRDHDNIEINQVSDIVAFFAMKDDAPWYCEHFYMSAKDKTCRTEVYVVPQDEFEEFIKIRKKMLSGGPKLYDLRH